jgi:hypothetical protein
LICRKGTGQRTRVESTFVKRGESYQKGVCKACGAWLILEDVSLEIFKSLRIRRGTIPLHERKVKG